jgi:transcription elongation GreA/GreB family factor
VADNIPSLQWASVVEAALRGAQGYPCERQAFIYRSLAEFCTSREFNMQFSRLAESADAKAARDAAEALKAQITALAEQLSRQ